MFIVSLQFSKVHYKEQLGNEINLTITASSDKGSALNFVGNCENLHSLDAESYIVQKFYTTCERCIKVSPDAKFYQIL